MYTLLLDGVLLQNTGMLLIILVCSLSAVDKLVSDLKQFESAFDTFSDWLRAAETRVMSLVTSALSSADDACAVLDAGQACLKEMLQKQLDLDSLVVMAGALHLDGVSSSRSVFQLSSRYSLTTKKLKVNMLTTQL